MKLELPLVSKAVVTAMETTRGTLHNRKKTTHCSPFLLNWFWTFELLFRSLENVIVMVIYTVRNKSDGIN